MKFFFISIFVSALSFAQTPQPVKWDAVFNSSDSTIQFTATIEKNWHIYSQTPNSDGPIPTTFSFERSDFFSRIDTVKEQNPERKMDEAFGVNVLYFNDKAVFKQKIKPLANDFILPCSVEFMVCNNATCLPPTTVKFNIIVKTVPASVSITKPVIKSPTKSKAKPKPKKKP